MGHIETQAHEILREFPIILEAAACRALDPLEANNAASVVPTPTPTPVGIKILTKSSTGESPSDRQMSTGDDEDGGGHAGNINKVQIEFNPMSVDVKFHDVSASKGNWVDLHFKEDKIKSNLDKERDPMAGIMDLMTNMYQEGDDEMKKTIAKAWTDARSGKLTDPMKNYR
ncbi:hypothetical protein E3N88_36771 [Mikania micrantha]|uniref:SGS domain-containing protein n=1 Tax=Mikania micrantha TaxID=192012 RepID=A0A5N6M573_9ASTR|nr:hypothetical protein E3N88_36771 [Mikania micrantha]